MSLGIAFKGPEGIVLAADSRATLHAPVATPQGQMFLAASLDNATKLLKVNGQSHVGAITYGAGAIGLQEPRTPHSFMPEFEASLKSKDRIGVEDFAKKLSDFFVARWTAGGMPNPAPLGQDMIFLVGGYDPDATYGRVFEIFVPSKPVPREVIPIGQFGAVWGGQSQIATRLINGKRNPTHWKPSLRQNSRQKFRGSSSHSKTASTYRFSCSGPQLLVRMLPLR
jgi:hypothetical protein